ncbi:ribosomal RNA assembly protein krr1 [Gurleya vavrai]
MKQPVTEIEFNDADIKHSFLETSKMSVVIPSYRVKYINDNFKKIEETLSIKKLAFEHEENTITVLTTEKTRDPYILIKGRDFINLLTRSVDLETASKVLDDKFTCEIVKTNVSKNKEVFVNRRARLEGPNGNTIKAIRLITKTDIFIQGKTVCIIGEYKRVKEAIQIVEGCFNNLHPVYLIKKLMVKRELEKDKEMEGVDWSRFLPDVKSKMKNKRGDGKKKKSIKEKKNKEKDISENKADDVKINSKKSRKNCDAPDKE